jgi:hypothetical protein
LPSFYLIQKFPGMVNDDPLEHYSVDAIVFFQLEISLRLTMVMAMTFVVDKF